MNRDRERAQLIQGLEALNKIFLRNDLSAGRTDLRRTLTSVVPQQNALYDSALEKVPGAITAFSQGDLSKSEALLKEIAYLENAERQAANWGYGINSHHPSELVGQYVVTGDMPMHEALLFNDLAQQSGLKFGTQREQQYGITRPGHNVAHTNQRTYQTGSFGSNENTAALFRQPDVYDRFESYLPSAMTEAEFSRLAYNLPQEQAVRQAAANFLQIPLERLTSTVRDPNQRKGGNVSIANRNRERLPEPIMKGFVEGAYGNGRAELVIPKLELVTPTMGKNKGVTRAEYVADPASRELDRLIQLARPGEAEVLRRFGL